MSRRSATRLRIITQRSATVARRLCGLGSGCRPHDPRRPADARRGSSGARPSAHHCGVRGQATTGRAAVFSASGARRACAAATAGRRPRVLRAVRWLCPVRRGAGARNATAPVPTDGDSTARRTRVPHRRRGCADCALLHAHGQARSERWATPVFSAWRPGRTCTYLACAPRVVAGRACPRPVDC